MLLSISGVKDKHEPEKAMTTNNQQPKIDARLLSYGDKVWSKTHGHLVRFLRIVDDYYVEVGTVADAKPLPDYVHVLMLGR